MSSVWPLPFNVSAAVIEKARAAKLVVFDVDGVLTDGSVTYGPGGEESKTFNVRDGQGIKSLQECGIDIAVISARNSPALSARAGELGIRRIEAGVTDKLAAFTSLVQSCGVAREQCCYVGDDLVDIPVMLSCMLGIAVADAHHTVRHVAHWVTPSPGGRGAARDVSDVILYAQKKFDDIMDRYMDLSTTS